ncbi:MAG: hypothetical protein Q9O74_06405 [Planctomycetota bacterium]|nr:hypothetical protein [Planctomycetota bacterium]
MQNVRPWQVVLFVVAAVAIVFSVARGLLADRPELSHQLYLVDIRTGEMFSIDPSGKSIPVPARSPVSGERDLYPAARDESGEWILDFRALNQVQADRAEAAEAIDINSGRVLDAGKVKRIRPRDLIKPSSAG